MRHLCVLLALVLVVSCAESRSDTDPNAAASGSGEGAAGEAGSGASTQAGRRADEAGNGGRAGSSPSATAGRSSNPPSTDGGAGRDASMTPPPDAGSADDAGPAPEPLCDGSSKVRLFFNVSGGFVWSTYEFTNPYGFQFLIVDGSCQYYVNSDYDKGIASGKLTVEEAAQLSAALHWAELDGWASYTSDAACPDAGGVQLGKLKSAPYCSCGCDERAPVGLADALANASMWVHKLEAQGRKLSGPVSVVLTAADRLDPRQAMIVDWPLARTITSIPNLVMGESDPKLRTGPYARFDDAAETKALREVRVRVDAQTANPLWVSEAGMRYQPFIRDELPEGIVAGIEELRASWPRP